jgi:protein-S-isoprenylcysteine O-methyltransferase Ste14
MTSFDVWFPLLVTLIIAAAVTLFEGVLRRGTARRSSKESADDKGTTTGVAVAFVICWLAILLSILLNQRGIGTVRPHSILNLIGGALMLAGIFVRVASARTLGRFYSRTLTTEADQHLVTSGLYGLVRHPGYLGTITLFVGSGIAVDNFITIFVILAAILPAYVRRITIEERMLERIFGQEFTHYRARTRKLIPLLY